MTDEPLRDTEEPHWLEAIFTTQKLVDGAEHSLLKSPVHTQEEGTTNWAVRCDPGSEMDLKQHPVS